MKSNNIRSIETSRITVNPNNPRARIEDVSDLVSSIKESGLIQPITVRWTKQMDADGIPTGYEVIAGARRLTACQALKMDKIPCIVRQADDAEAFKLATMENIVRENMTAVDEANAVAKLYSQGHSRTEIAAMFGKSVRWAEGRRNIVKIGEKAMEALASGSINLGHAEVLTLCSPDRVERFLEAAKWNTPAQLKTMILNERKRLDKAPFNVAKVCKNCENRSDCQQELFGDVNDSYCLNEDCYKQQIEKEVARIRANFEKQGWKPVDEDDLREARYGYCDYVNATSEDEYDQEDIKRMKDAGVKPRYWIDETTAENGLVFWEQDYKAATGKTDEDEAEDSDGYTDEQPRDDWALRNEIRMAANKAEEFNVRQVITGYMSHIDTETIALLLTVFTDRSVTINEANEDGETIERDEPCVLHIGEKLIENEMEVSQRHALIEDMVERVIGYNGVRDELRAYFVMEPRATIEANVREDIIAEQKQLEAEAEKAETGETDD